MRALLLVSLVASGCVLDRTGRSAPSAFAKELAEHDRRVAELEATSEDISRRVSQLEEVGRARGQEEILKMETMEQLRQEVANLRGDLETLQHDNQTFEQAGIGFQTDSDWRMTYTEQRIAAVEKTLGLKSPPPPPKDGAVAETAPPSTDPATTPTGTTPTPPPSTDTAAAASSPDEYFGIIAQNLQEGKGAAARAVAKRFLAEYPKSDRAPEAYYRIAESFQNENDFAGAASAFQVVVDKYADSTWAPWSMLRQGECFEALGKHDEAALFWSETAKKYPKSKAAKEAKAHLGK